jgi:hypothetical protein
MRNDKYDHMDEKTMLGFLSNALFDNGGDRGATFPRSDAEDMSRGLRFIPGEVTVERRKGNLVAFVDQHCNHACCWYWQFPDGSRTYYWERGDYEQIAQHNGKTKNDKGNYPDGTGPCPECGNIHTRGGHVKAESVGKDA